ncbi:MAG: YbaB/EbfC family nucleoid-associated protein, partial [Planctomycetes bacterium]|nr:YbaB/EbfC family nucleoid-associated protein [Planctomycetota bacterium]
DKALVEDLIVAAVSQGLEKSRALMRQEMEKVTGDQGLAGLLPGLLG